MATANYTNPDPVDGVTGSDVRARICWKDGTTAGEAALIERQTPRPEGAFFFPVPFAFTLQPDPNAEYTIEVRQVPTQDSAGFDSSSTTNIRLAFGAFTVDAAGTISDGGQAGAAAGTTTFRLKIGDASGTLIDEDGLTSVTVKAPGIIAQGSSTAAVATGTAFTHTAVGVWTGPTVTDAASGLLYLYTLVKSFADGHTEDVPQVQAGSTSSGATAAPGSTLVPCRSRELPRIIAGTAPATVWVITDANGDAVDLSAKTLRFVAYSASGEDCSDPLFDVVSPLYKYETGSGITIGSGANTNVVTLQHSAANTAAYTGELRYILLNATDAQALATGRLPVLPAPTDV